MTEDDVLADRFEENRSHLRAVAYRMLGSLTEADDAVQEAWLRMHRAGTGEVENLGGWLTTIVARVSLDMLRSRRARREELGSEVPEAVARPDDGADPEREAVLADSVGIAMLVVLETLAPAERLAFVLHDMFAVPFDEIAPIVGRSAPATRQLASRARRRVQGNPSVSESDLARRRAVVEAFLAAARGGDFEALLAILDPDVELRVDPVALRPGGAAELHGAAAVAGQALLFSRGAPAARPALVNGDLGFVVAPAGHLRLVFAFAFRDGRIARMEVIADPERLRGLDLAVLDERSP